MSNNKKLIAGLFLGAAAGTALTLFAKSKKGKKMISEASTKVSHLKDATVDVLQDEISNISNKSELIKNEATELIKEISKLSSRRVKNIKSAVNGKA